MKNNNYELINQIKNFSHAYILDSDNMNSCLEVAKYLAKKIICQDFSTECQKDCNICHLIDENTFDDLLIINPDTISIKMEEINQLFSYFETKSVRNKGNRVYIIYGFERLREDSSNKILKFLEEPQEGIYAILLTENISAILPTITSRCQTIKMRFNEDNTDLLLINNMKNFINKIVDNGTSTIAYEHTFFNDITNREEILNNFSIIEKIFTNTIEHLYISEFNNDYVITCFKKENVQKVINMLEKTIKLKSLIKNNINLNLLIDRFIIEISEER